MYILLFIEHNLDVSPEKKRDIYHLPIQWIPGAFSLKVKWSEFETDNLPPSSAEIKMNGAA